MKHILLMCLIITTAFLQSCDERISPSQGTGVVETPPSTNSLLLTAHSWQYSEVTLRGGGQTKVQFSRSNSINLSSDLSTTKVTYKVDGSYLSESKSGVTNGTWKFGADEKQLILTDDKGKRQVFDIVVLATDKFNFSLTAKKADAGDDALWALTMQSLGLPATTTELVTSFSQITI
ncbi:MAG: hypothetical protein V4585_07355 [Bacteroidota bacterium]